MANIILNPVFTGEGRVFINEEGYGGGTKFKYHNNMKVDGLDRSLGDYEPVYLPDPNNYDEFVEVGSIKGAASRVTSTLSGKLPINTYSGLELLADRGCAFNLQVHYGRCTRPDDFATFESAIIIKEARLTNYNLSTLVASNPSERALIDETAGVNAKSFYRIFNQTLMEIKPNLSGKLLKLIHADLRGCSTLCSAYQDGNKIWIGLVDSTVATLAITKDGGITWENGVAFSESTKIHSAGHPFAILATAGNYLIWSISDNTNVTRVIATDLAEYINLGFVTEISVAILTDFVPTGVVVTSSYMYFTGYEPDESNGKVYRVDKNTLISTLIFSSSTGITSIDALDDDFVVIGLLNGSIYYSEVSGFFSLVNDLGALPVNHIKIHDEQHWIAVSGSKVYVTIDSGLNWINTFTINISGVLTYGAWYDELVGYIIHGSTIYRTIDSGTTWKRLYTNGSDEESLTMAISPYNPNLFMAAYTISGTTSVTIKGFV